MRNDKHSYILTSWMMILIFCTVFSSDVSAFTATVSSKTAINFDDIKIPVKSGYASDFQVGEEIEKSFDGDLSTFYHCNWGSPDFPITLKYRFVGVERIDYMVYYPRPVASGYNGNFMELEVWASTKANRKAIKIGEYDFHGSPYPSKIEFPDSIVDPVEIEVIVKSGSGDGQNFASCSEMLFYRKDPRNDVTAIFTDASCSALRPTVTQEKINAISNDFYRRLALAFQRREYASEYRVQSYRPYPHPDVKAEENRTFPYSLLDNPTGICVENGEDVVVFVGDTGGEAIYLRVIDFSEGYDGATYGLMEGANILKMSKKGLLYVMYHSENPDAKPITVHIASGRVNGYYDVTRHSNADWERLLDNAQDVHFDVVGKYAHLVFPVSAFKQYCSDGAKLIDTYDNIVRLQQDFTGLYKYNRANENRMFFHVVYNDGAYMYATYYRTAYHEGTLRELCNPDVLRTTAIWGPVHEVGHCNQLHRGFTWVGMTEVSNNLYSLYIQKAFGNATRLSDKGDAAPWGSRYEKGFTTLVGAKIPYGTHDDVFVKLIPLWQLQLYYAEVKGYNDFYKDVHEQIRRLPNPETSVEAQLNFVTICSDVAKEDLSDFFTDWGFLRPMNARVEDYSPEHFTCTPEQIAVVKKHLAQYRKPELKLSYIHDGCLDSYTKKKNAIAGKATIDGSSITIEGSRNVVVFEVYDSTKKLQFVSPSASFDMPQEIKNPTIYAIAADGKRTRVR